MTGRWFAALSLIVFAAAGCGPKYTYPAETVPKAIEDIAWREYKIKADARVVGKTVGAMFYLDNILDSKGQMDKDVHEKMGQIMQVVTRVALSTDLPLDFCTVVIRDKSQGNEFVIARSLDDTKRANAEAIGIEESINRTLFGQAKYEPGSKNPFVLKEIKLEKFLTDQIVQRIRFGYSRDAKDEAAQPLVLVDGVFNELDGERSFRFSVLDLKSDDARQNILGLFKTVSETLKGYHFSDYDKIEVLDYFNRQKLVVDRPTVEDYQAKKMKDDELLDRFLEESESIQEAFKLFGFQIPQDSENGAAPMPRTTP